MTNNIIVKCAQTENIYIFKYDKTRDVYLHKIDEHFADILVYRIDEENWMPYDEAGLVGDYCDDENKIYIANNLNALVTFKINLELFDKGIQYIKYYPSNDDAGMTELKFSMKKYLQEYEYEIYDKITKNIRKQFGDVQL